jgi:hypothetical protein
MGNRAGGVGLLPRSGCTGSDIRVWVTLFDQGLGNTPLGKKTRGVSRKGDTFASGMSTPFDVALDKKGLPKQREGGSRSSFNPA